MSQTWLQDRTGVVVGLSVAHVLWDVQGGACRKSLYQRLHIPTRRHFFFKSFSWSEFIFLKIHTLIILSTRWREEPFGTMFQSTIFLLFFEWCMLTLLMFPSISMCVHGPQNIRWVWLFLDYLYFLGDAISLIWQRSSFSPLFTGISNGNDTLHFGFVGYTPSAGGIKG